MSEKEDDQNQQAIYCQLRLSTQGKNLKQEDDESTTGGGLIGAQGCGDCDRSPKISDAELSEQDNKIYSATFRGRARLRKGRPQKKKD